MYIYILRSKRDPHQTYVGATPDVKLRLAEHNAGESVHTSKYIPWEIEASIWISDADKAFRLEKYLKSGSGRAFRKKHL